METLKEVLHYYEIAIVIYSLSVTALLVIIIARQKTLRNRFIDWKRDTIRLPGFSREWERNDDWLQNELYSENIKLQGELNIKNKDFTKLTLITLILLVPIVIKSKLKKD